MNLTSTVFLALLISSIAFAQVDSRIIGSWKSECARSGIASSDGEFLDLAVSVNANSKSQWIVRYYNDPVCAGNITSILLLQNYVVDTQGSPNNSTLIAHYRVGDPDLVVPNYSHYIDYRYVYKFKGANKIIGATMEYISINEGVTEHVTYQSPRPFTMTRIQE